MSSSSTRSWVWAGSGLATVAATSFFAGLWFAQWNEKRQSRSQKRETAADHPRPLNATAGPAPLETAAHKGYWGNAEEVGISESSEDDDGNAFVPNSTSPVHAWSAAHKAQSAGSRSPPRPEGRKPSAGSNSGSHSASKVHNWAGDLGVEPVRKESMGSTSIVDRHVRGSPIIIGVCGASGSGKTSIASVLKKRLPLPPHKVVSISTDSYYRPLSAEDMADTDHYNFDHPDAIEFPLVTEHLAALKRGEPIDVPTYDFSVHQRTEEVTRIEKPAVVIVDGIFTLHVHEVRRLCDLTVFCFEDLDVCLARRLLRDINERKRDPNEVITRYQRFVKPGYHTFIAPTMTKADLIIPRARDNTRAIEMLARDLSTQCDVDFDDEAVAAPEEELQMALLSSIHLQPGGDGAGSVTHPTRDRSVAGGSFSGSHPPSPALHGRNRLHAPEWSAPGLRLAEGDNPETEDAFDYSGM